MHFHGGGMHTFRQCGVEIHLFNFQCNLVPLSMHNVSDLLDYSEASLSRWMNRCEIWLRRVWSHYWHRRYRSPA